MKENTSKKYNMTTQYTNTDHICDIKKSYKNRKNSTNGY